MSLQIQDVESPGPLNDYSNDEPPVNKGKPKAIKKQSSTPELEDELLSPETGHDDIPSPQGAIRDHIDLRMGNHWVWGQF
jgi:hypothetical protein